MLVKQVLQLKCVVSGLSPNGPWEHLTHGDGQYYIPLVQAVCYEYRSLEENHMATHC